MPYDAESQGEHSPRSPQPLLIATKSQQWAPPKTSKRGWLETRYGRLCAGFGLLCFAILGTSYLVITLKDRPTYIRLDAQNRPPWHGYFADNSNILNNSKPASRFRDNLGSSQTKFITAWPSSGWTNDVMAAVNLIYLGMLTGRTPVLPPFTPSHVGSINDVGPIAFRDIFDVPRLANQLGMHIVEWDELKNPAIAAALSSNVSSEVEQLGCWSTWSLSKVGGGRPRDSAVPQWYNLDISYTPVPPSFTLSHGHLKDQYYASVWSLASLAFPRQRDWAWAVQNSRALPTATGSQKPLKPDDQMLCFDLLYYIGLANEEEWFADYSPYWKSVGVHMFWAPRLIDIAEGYLRRHFSVVDGQPIPPFISVHVRRADFAGWCPSNMNKEACFAPSSAYAQRVKDIQTSLRARPEGGIDVHHVLVTSDERDPEWWAEISELGPEWSWIDHAAEQTVQKHGKWYPVVLDAVFQSMGVGFVGTDHSTMSALAQKRVEDWNHGLGAEHPGAIHQAEGILVKTPIASTTLTNGNATIKYRENLLPSHKYVTAFSSSGFTNQVMSTVNLIYISILTGRVPIIPPFLPEHFGSLETVSPITFGEIFDLPRLATQLDTSIIEWHEVKDPKSPETESIGCWSTRSGLKATGYTPALSSHTSVLKLDVSYTPIPSTFTLSRGTVENEYIFSAWAIASLGYPETRQLHLDSGRAHILPGNSGKKAEPDDHLLCFDLLYYVGVVEPSPAADFFADYSPFWNVVGTHMHWHKSVTDLATQYLRRHFGVMDDKLIPPFISVHVRRSDFKDACSKEQGPEQCFAPVKAYERRVNEVKQGLRDRPNGVQVTKVIVTSDERDPRWWDEIAALGPEWSWIDHGAEQTAKKYGKWYPMILDAAIQSMGAGFVGTQASTMSRIAQKRVQDWQGGLGAEVRWGSLHADDH